MSKFTAESTPAHMAARNPFLVPQDTSCIDVASGSVSGSEASRIDFRGQLRYSLRDRGGRIEIVESEDVGVDAALDCWGHAGECVPLAFQVQGGNAIDIDAFLSAHAVWSADSDGYSGGWIRCVPESGHVEHGNGIRIDRAVFPVVNGPALKRGSPVAYGTPSEIILCDGGPPDHDFSRTDCAAWEWDGWRIQIVAASQPKSKKRGAPWNERQGMAVTHCGEIHRSDGAPFTMRDVADAHLQIGLRLFLSFLKGAKVAVPVIRGMGFGFPFCASNHSVSQYTGYRGWFHGQKMDKRLAADIFPAFCNALLRNYRLFLTKAQMYLDAIDSSAALQTKVLAAHGLLELILREPEDRPADFMAKVVERAGFCNKDIPTYWHDGLSHEKPHNLHGPEKLRGTLSERLRHLRNQFTHMDFYRCENTRGMWQDADCVPTAWRCYTQLAELLLLRDLGYEGQYLVKAGGAEPRIETVPWAAEVAPL